MSSFIFFNLWTSSLLLFSIEYTSPPFTLASNASDQGIITEVDHQGNIIAIWTNGDEINKVIKTARQEAGRMNWKELASIPTIPEYAPFDHQKYQMQLAFDHLGNAIALFVVYRNDEQVIHGAKLEANGENWTLTTPLSPIGQSSFYPNIKVDKKGNVYAIWYNVSTTTIQYAKLAAGSSKWTSCESISPTSSNFFSPNSLSMDEAGNLYAIWTRFDITLNRFVIEASFNQKGHHWNTPVVIASSIHSDFVYPAIASHKANYAVAIFNNATMKKVLSSVFTKEKGWSTPYELDSNITLSSEKCIVMDEEGNTTIAYTLNDRLIRISQLLFNRTWNFIGLLRTRYLENLHPKLFLKSNEDLLVAWSAVNKIEKKYAIFTSLVTKGKTSKPAVKLMDLTRGSSPNFSGNVKGDYLLYWLDSQFAFSSQRILQKDQAIIEPISNLIGMSKKKDNELKVKIKWEPSKDPQIKSYRVYSKGNLLAEIPATEPCKFVKYKKIKKKTKGHTYQVTAVNTNEQESTPTLVVIK